MKIIKRILPIRFNKEIIIFFSMDTFGKIISKIFCRAMKTNKTCCSYRDNVSKLSNILLSTGCALFCLSL